MRPLRVHYPGAIFHVYARGVEGRSIFLDDADRHAFLRDLLEVKKLPGVRVLAYCLMGNHYHLLLQVMEATIGRVMHRLTSRYANRFNARHGRDGHLFQRRFEAKLCEDPEYLRTLLVYIHRNPVQDGFVIDPADWPWSSHRGLLGGFDPYLDRARIFEVLGQPAEAVLADYRQRLERATLADEIVIVPAAGAALGLDALAAIASERCGVRSADLLGGVRTRDCMRARLLLLELAKAHGHRTDDVARRLGCGAEALRRLRWRDRCIRARPQ